MKKWDSDGRRQPPETDIAEQPVVFCHGLFGWGKDELAGYPYFFSAARLVERHPDSFPPVLFPATGPLSSLHDQACELFYQLKGGLVNYGKEHSSRFGHAQFSGDYRGKGLYPEWDADHPLDFVAHSMGGPVVRMLQHLLATGFFSAEDSTDYRTSSRWVRSLTTIAGVHNGSTLTWMLGASEETGLVRRDARLVRMLVRLIERYVALQSKHRGLEKFYDFSLDQWGIKAGETVGDSVRNLFADTAFVESADWALPDLTPNAMKDWNRILVEYPGTWYFSYVTRATVPFAGFQIPVPFFTHWFLLPFAFGMGTYRADAKWRANDGMCPSFSQDYPHEGRVAAFGDATRSFRDFGKTVPRTGVWYVRERLAGTDHAEVAMLPHSCRVGRGMRLYDSILKTILKMRTIHER